MVDLALGEKPNGTTRTSAKDSPSDATQTVNLNAEEHDRSYLVDEDEAGTYGSEVWRPVRSSARLVGHCSRCRRRILPLDEYAGDEAFVSAVVDETHPETTQMPVARARGLCTGIRSADAPGG